MQFCGAVARALLLGVCESSPKTVGSESKRKEVLRLLLEATAVQEIARFVK